MGKKEPVIICRCNDVTLDDIERAISEGCKDLECLRKKLRIGMGPCQGRICIPLLLRILSKRLGKKINELSYPTIRPPIVPVPAKLFIKHGDEK